MDLIDDYPELKRKESPLYLEEEDCVELSKKEKILIWTCILCGQVALGLIIYFIFLAG